MYVVKSEIFSEHTAKNLGSVSESDSAVDRWLKSILGQTVENCKSYKKSN